MLCTSCNSNNFLQVLNPREYIQSKEEKKLLSAVMIRARAIEQKTGIPFNQNWKPGIGILESAGTGNISGQKSGPAVYLVEKQKIMFEREVIPLLEKKYGKPFLLLEPKVIANEIEFSKLADHELGHALTDTISRRLDRGHFITLKRLKTLTKEEQLGLHMISEGIAVFFEQVLSHTKQRFIEIPLPSSPLETELYPREMIVYQGGHWIVDDILSRFGEKGLVWLIINPFVPKKNIREDAKKYRERAFYELSSLGHTRDKHYRSNLSL